MKKLFYILFAASAILFASCAKEMGDNNTASDAKLTGETITFTASIDMPALTRAELSSLNINWLDGDYIGIATDNAPTIVAYPVTVDALDPTKCTITVDKVDGANGYYAIFRGSNATYASNDFTGVTFNAETKTFSGLTVGKQQCSAGEFISHLYIDNGYPLAMAGKANGASLSMKPCLALVKMQIASASVPAEYYYKTITYKSSYDVDHPHDYSAVRGFDFYQKGASTIYSSGDFTVQVANDGTLTTAVVDNATKREYRQLSLTEKMASGTDYYMCLIPGGSITSFKFNFLGYTDANDGTIDWGTAYSMSLKGARTVAPGDFYDLGVLNPLGRKKAKNEAEDEIADELAAFSPKITIDGTFSDWSAISALPSSYAEVSEWKVASDAYYLYMYFKVNKTIIGSGGWGSYFYTGLDMDNNPSNGDGHHGTGGGNEAMIGVFPFTGNDPVGFKTGTDPNGGVEYPVNTATGVKVTTNGVVDGDYALVETSIPRSSIGNPANGLTIVLSPAMNYNALGKQSFVLSN